MSDPSADSRRPDDHWVQLFDDESSRADAVAGFAARALAEHHPVLLLLDAHRSVQVRNRLERLGVDETTIGARLTILDARVLLDRIAPHGRLDARRFQSEVNGVLDALETGGRDSRPHIYGELVDLLAAEGRPAAALRLEACWNALAAERSFVLLCGYASAHFGDETGADALRAICRAHSQVRSHPRDALGNFLLQSHAVTLE